MSENTTLNGSAQESLKNYVERYERLDEEVKALREDQKELMAAAKSEGFDAKIIRQVVKIRKMDQHDRMEQEALLDVYLHALGSGAFAQPTAEVVGIND